jgi:hypothetical protein
MLRRYSFQIHIHCKSKGESSKDSSGSGFAASRWRPGAQSARSGRMALASDLAAPFRPAARSVYPCRNRSSFGIAGISDHCMGRRWRHRQAC